MLCKNNHFIIMLKSKMADCSKLNINIAKITVHIFQKTLNPLEL
jgi:hypothetical protein